MRDTIKLGLVLMVIAAISGISLAYVNRITNPIIAERKQEQESLAMNMVVPEACRFEKLSEDQIIEVKKVADDFSTLKTVSLGYDEDGLTVGAVIVFTVNGYGGPIEMLVGVDSDIKISGMQIMSHSETAGLGAKITQESFVSQFIGHSISNPAKISRSGGDIDAIAGATISSNAAITAANLAVRIAECVMNR